MLVRDRMSKNPISVDATATLGVALELMATHKIRELPVLEGGAMCGILTDRDLKMALGPDSRHMDIDAIDPRQLEGAVDWFMTPNVETVKARSTLAYAARKLIDLRVGALPVVDDHGKLCGMISTTDFVLLAAEFLENQG